MPHNIYSMYMYMYIHYTCMCTMHTVCTTVGVPGGNSPGPLGPEFQEEVIGVTPIEITNLGGKRERRKM